MDPFDVLGLPPAMDLDSAELERVYLRLSRECHPDYHQDSPPEEQVAVLARSAEVNEAYRVLRDPWTRARAILERAEPGVMERTKQLPADFLMAAMEQAEEVAGADAASSPALRERLEARVAACRDAVRAEIDAGRWERAASLLHRSRYHRKALHDLEEGPS